MEHEDTGPVPVSRTVDFGVAKLLPDVDRRRAWLLTVDGAPQSYVDLDDPRHLEFEYVRRIAHAVRAGFVEGAAIDAVHLGGGALTLPRWLARERPGSRQQVVEADRGLVELVAEVLPWDDSSVAVHVGDARAWIAAAEPASADLVIADVFGGSRVPAALTSVEFVRDALRLLRPHGVYLANLADSAPFGFLRPQLATVRAALAGTGSAGGEDARRGRSADLDGEGARTAPGPGAGRGDLCVLAEPGVLRGRRFGNAVLVASRRPLPVDALSRLCAADAFPARVVHGADLTRLIGGVVPVQDSSAAPSPEPPAGAFTVG